MSSDCYVKVFSGHLPRQQGSVKNDFVATRRSVASMGLRFQSAGPPSWGKFLGSRRLMPHCGKTCGTARKTRHLCRSRNRPGMPCGQLPRQKNLVLRWMLGKILPNFACSGPPAEGPKHKQRSQKTLVVRNEPAAGTDIRPKLCRMACWCRAGHNQLRRQDRSCESVHEDHSQPADTPL